MTKLLYFSWVRERIGLASEERDIPASVTTVEQFLEWMSGQGPEYENALAEASSLRVALDQTHVTSDAPISGAREIAIFPPMTGG